VASLVKTSPSTVRPSTSTCAVQPFSGVGLVYETSRASLRSAYAVAEVSPPPMNGS
jgi:hypothetical protein